MSKTENKKLSGLLATKKKADPAKVETTPEPVKVAAPEPAPAPAKVAAPEPAKAVVAATPVKVEADVAKAEGITIIPAHRAIEVVSDLSVNAEQTAKINAINKKIEELPGHKNASKIHADFMERKKAVSPAKSDSDDVKKEKEQKLKDLKAENDSVEKKEKEERDKDKTTKAYTDLVAERKETSSTKVRSAGDAATTAAMAAQLAAIEFINNVIDNTDSTAKRFTLDAGLQSQQSLLFTSLYIHGSHCAPEYAAFITRSKKAEIEKQLKTTKVEEVEKDETDAHDANDTDTINPVSFASYVKKLFDSALSSRTTEFKCSISGDLKQFITYIIFDTLTTLGICTTVSFQHSDSKTLTSKKISEFVQMLLSVANIPSVKVEEILKLINSATEQVKAIKDEKKAEKESKITPEQKEKLQKEKDEKARLSAQKKAILDKAKADAKAQIQNIK
jgi:hypothetical protein